MEIKTLLKNLFKKCEHNNITDALNEQEIVREIYVWEKNKPSPNSHYWELWCPDCKRCVTVECWHD